LEKEAKVEHEEIHEEDDELKSDSESESIEIVGERIHMSQQSD